MWMCTCMYVPEQVCGSQKTTSGVHPHLPPCLRPGLMFTTMYGRLSGQELPRILSVSHLLVGMCYLIHLWVLGIQASPPPPSCLYGVLVQGGFANSLQELRSEGVRVSVEQERSLRTCRRCAFISCEFFLKHKSLCCILCSREEFMFVELFLRTHRWILKGEIAGSLIA